MRRYVEQARRLKELKSFLDFSEDIRFAESVGVSTSAMSGYMNADRMSLDLIVKLYEVHKVNPMWFLFGVGPRIYSEEPSVDPAWLKSKVLSLDHQSRKDIAVELVKSLANE